MVTHIVGGGLGIIALVICLLRTTNTGSMAGIVTSVIYGCSMIAVYLVASHS